MTTSFEPELASTGIGSLPLTDADEAAAFVLDRGPSIPFWPQLPKRSPAEQMIPQYSERMPCVSASGEDGALVCDPGAKYDVLGGFYEDFLKEEPDLFPISEQHAAGFHGFIKAARGRKWPFVKGQVTGPITFSVGISDADRRPLYSDAELRDAALKLLTRKAEWQIRRLAGFAEKGVIIFADEPVLSAFGSSVYLGISEEDVRSLEGELFQAIEAAGGISGIHVCGNSDWGVVIRTGVRIVNFDAYQCGERMALYADDVRALFERGGSIAWGIVPTTPRELGMENADSLAERFRNAVKALVAKGFSEDLVLAHSLLTPSCGAGSLTVEEAAKVFKLLADLRRLLQS